MSVNSKLLEEDAVLEKIGSGKRVDMKQIIDSIKSVDYFILGHALGLHHDISDSRNRVTMCVVKMKNGFTVIGKSACVDPARFDIKTGEEYAYKDAIRQVWEPMGYSLMDKIYESSI